MIINLKHDQGMIVNKIHDRLVTITSMCVRGLDFQWIHPVTLTSKSIIRNWKRNLTVNIFTDVQMADS